MTRYTVLEVSRRALIHECQECGALVYHRATHDAWHVLYDVMADIRLDDVDLDLEP